MLNSIQKYLLFLSILGLTSGCSFLHNNFLHKKDLLYLQDQEGSFERYKLEEYKIQPRDLLSVNLSSPDINITTYFNRDNSSGLRIQQSDPASLYRRGYTVNDSGDITLPMIGKIEVEGKTVGQLEADISEIMKSYLKEFSISVKLTNFRITLLGEVNRPGTYYFYENKVTILQAISQAGGFTNYANRNKVRIIREKGDKSEVLIIDLESAQAIESQNFLLTQADAIYVEPLKSKVFSINGQMLSLVLSVITSSVTIYGIVTR